MNIRSQKQIFVSLKKKKDIGQLFNRNLERSQIIVLHSDYFIIRGTKQPDISLFPLFLLISIPKKLAIAVKRNKFKRQIKASLYDILKPKAAKNSFSSTGLHIAVIAKKPILNASFEQIKQMLEVEMIKLLKKNEQVRATVREKRNKSS